MIEYDDGDNEDYDEDDLHQAMRLYKNQQANYESKSTPMEPRNVSEPAETSKLMAESLTNIEDIPMVCKSDKLKRKTCLQQPEKNRQVYYTGQHDTPTKIAKRFKIDVQQIIRDNKRQNGYEKLRKGSKFDQNSPIVLPLTKSNESK